MKKFIDGSPRMTRVATPFLTFDEPVFVMVPEKGCAQFAMSLAKFRDAYMHKSDETFLCIFATATPMYKILHKIFDGSALRAPAKGGPKGLPPTIP